MSNAREVLPVRQLSDTAWEIVAPEGFANVELGGFRPPYVVKSGDETVAVGASEYARVVAPGGAGTLRIESLPLDEALAQTPRKPRQRWRTNLVDDARMRFLRTSLLGHLPGFAGAATAHLAAAPWAVAVGAHAVHDLVLRPRLEGTDGILDVDVSADVPLRAVVTGPNGRFEAPVVAGRSRVHIPEVEMWWPHTHGVPALHHVEIHDRDGAVALPGDGSQDLSFRSVGFRSVANRDPDALALAINDVDVFVRGAVWTPGSLAALDQAAALGLNLIRVPGWSRYESDAFHTRCDELGLLVWQDLMFASLDYPVGDDAFAAVVRHEAAGAATRLTEHPSSVVVCGSSETEQQAAMFGVPVTGGAARELPQLLGEVVRRTSPELVWVDSSPTVGGAAGQLPFRNDTGVAHYFGVGGYRRPLADARMRSVRFASECLAFANVPDGDLPAMGTADWKAGVPRDVGAAWDFDDVRDYYVRELFGEDPGTVTQAREATGWAMAAVFGDWRRRESPCAGGIVLWLRDLVPGAGWGLLDHRGQPKECARVAAQVWRPVAVWLTDEGLDGLDIHLANDTAKSVMGSVTVQLLRSDGSVTADGAVDAVVPPREVGRLSVEAVTGRFADASYAYRFGEPAHDRVEVTWRTPEQTLTAHWQRPASG